MGRVCLGCLVVLSVLGAVTAILSDLRLCADPECKELISKGVTVLSYPSSDKDILSFPNNAQVLVYSKEAGTRRDLWGVEIKGKRGYAPSKYIREHKIYKKPAFEVPTEAVAGKDETGDHGKHNLSQDSLPQESRKTEEEAAAEGDFAKSLKVAISAEDVEYNKLLEKAPEEKHHQDEKSADDGAPANEIAQPEQDEPSKPSGSEGDTPEGDASEEKEEDGQDKVKEEGKEVLTEKEEKHDGEEKDIENNDVGETGEEGANETEEAGVSEDDGKTDEVPGENEDLDDKDKDKGIPEPEDKSVEDAKNMEDNVVKNEEDSEVVDGSTSDSPASDGAKEDDVTKEEAGDVVVDPSEPVLEQNPESTQTLSPAELKEEPSTPEKPENPIDLEPSSVSFEVIDGTTLYFDEDVNTATTTTQLNPQTSELPAASPVASEAPATLPIPALLHHSPPTTPPSNKDADDSKSTNLESGSDQVVDPASPGKLASDDKETASENVELPASTSDTEHAHENTEHFTDKENTSTTDDTVPNVNDHDKGNPDAVDVSNPASPPAVDDEAEATPPTTEEPQNEFADPKVETIIETADIPTEKPAENEGFFASWFGSSETTEEEEEEEEIPDTPESSKSETSMEDSADVQASSSEDINDLKAGGVVSHDADLPLDDASVPGNESEGADSDHHTSHENEYVDENVPTESSASNLSLIDSDPTAASDTEPTPDGLPALPDNVSSALGNTANDAATEDSEEDAGSYIGGEEEEPGPSTARPMYAEPEPTTQSYTDANVDSDELSRLAGAEKTVAEDTQENTVQESLTEKFLKASHNLLPEGLAFGVEAEVAEPEMSHGTLVFLGVVVFAIITLYVVHFIMLKFSRESPILEALNSMDREKRLLVHENTSLHEELLKARSELEAITSRITESSGDVSDLDAQLEVIKSEHAAETALQEEKIAQLEHELEEATNNSIEMHKMLSEMLSAQKDTSTFQASVDHLQQMLDGQQEKVEALNSDLALKTRLNEELHLELSSSKEQVAKLDSQVQQEDIELTQSLKELSSSKEETGQQLVKEIQLVKELQNINDSLSKHSVDSDQQVTDLNQELHELQNTVASLRESVETKDSELKVAKECLKKFQLTSEDAKATPDDEKLSSLFDVIKIKAELQRVSSERLNLEDQLKDSEMAQKNLEDAMSSIRSEVTELRTMHDEAIQEKQEAISKLAVLTQYFEEKEAQLTKELESQEGLRMNAEGTAASVAHKIHNYELDVASFKSQIESLQKELQDQEKSYKTQLDSCEKKAHDNWLQARAAERKHEEQRQENSQLRNRLTLLQKEREDIQTGILKPTPKRPDANGRMSSPGPLIEGELDGEHSESPHHHLHGPPSVLPMMLPPGAPLPPGIPPPHGFPGVPPPPPPPGLPRGVPPFHPGEFPFMRPPLPPLPGDRRLPPAGGMSSPPFRRSGSPTYRNDRYSPSSEHSHLSDRHYSPPPLRHRPPSPDMHRRIHSPDRRSDRLRSPDRRSDRVRASPDHHHPSSRRTPDHRLDRRSPDRHFTRSPDGYHRQRSSPHDYYDHSDYNSDDSRLHHTPHKGKKTSTPLASSDRWKSDV